VILTFHFKCDLYLSHIISSIVNLYCRAIRLQYETDTDYKWELNLCKMKLILPSYKVAV
jgi:hypothetical protein